MPKIVKLSRRLGRLTLKEERDYGKYREKYTALMQLELSTFDHDMDRLTRFQQQSKEIIATATDLTYESANSHDEKFFHAAEVAIEDLRNALSAKLKLMRKQKHRAKEMNKQLRVQAAPTPPNQPSAILSRAQSVPLIVTMATTTPGLNLPASTAAVDSSAAASGATPTASNSSSVESTDSLLAAFPAGLPEPTIKVDTNAIVDAIQKEK